MTTKQIEQLYRQAGATVPPEIAGTPAPSKYHARKKEIDGIVFDSSLEARAYQILRQWEHAGEIRELQLQSRFVLQTKFRDSEGKTHRAIEYVCDFEFIHHGRTVVVDVKGFKTPVFRMKEKLFRARFPNVELQLWDRQKVKEIS